MWLRKCLVACLVVVRWFGEMLVVFIELDVLVMSMIEVRSIGMVMVVFGCVSVVMSLVSVRYSSVVGIVRC